MARDPFTTLAFELTFLFGLASFRVKIELSLFVALKKKPTTNDQGVTIPNEQQYNKADNMPEITMCVRFFL